MCWYAPVRLMSLFSCLAFCAMLLTACSTTSHKLYSVQDIPPFHTSNSINNNHQTLTAEQARHATSSVDILALSPEILRYTDRYIHRDIPREQRARLLHQILRSPAFLGIEYNGRSSYSAQDVIKYSQANCLSFANLYIALARHYGLSASYRMVESFPEWNRMGDMLAMNIHMNTSVNIRGDYQLIVDINVDNVPVNGKAKVLTDDEAFSHFYNNLATEALTNGNYEKAYGLLAIALTLDTDSAMLWSNLGALLRANKQLHDAETAYQVAIELNPHFYSALNNLAVLYYHTGRFSEYQQLIKQVETVREKNPYYHFALAERAVANDNLQKAQRHLQRAIQLKPEEASFNQLLDTIQNRLQQQFSQVGNA